MIKSPAPWFLPFRTLAPAIPAFAALLLATGCGPQPVAEPPITLDQVSALTFGTPVEQSEESAGVRVAISAARLDPEWIILRGSFTPLDAGYHLYSKDLPMEGIDGTGRPTRLEVTDGAIQVGTVIADREPHDLKQFDLTLPVYPEGPVTLYRLARAKTGANLTLALTYMSCSSELCNAPVEKSPLTITAP
jgi:hypothetical protein